MSERHGTYARNITELVGKTPLLEIPRMAEAHGVDPSTRVLVKLEYFNPSSSVKDRAALSIIRAAEESGELREGGTIVEATSGNMGIGLAMCAAALGYRMIATMPSSMSIERRKLMAHLGVKLELTDAAAGMSGAMERAEEIVAATDNAIAAHQFQNTANPEAHHATTGPELWEATGGVIDAFVAGVGTGGTITGTGRYLREKNEDIELYAVEPVDSPVLSGGEKGPHGIQGIGAGFVPEVLDPALITEVITASTHEAIARAQEIARTEGVLVGISAGAALDAGLRVAARPESEGKTIVILLPDTGERYLSTALFAGDE